MKRRTGSDRLHARTDLAGDQCDVVHGRGASGLRIGGYIVVSLGLIFSCGCGPSVQTVLQMDFNADTLGQPPAKQQTVGSVNFYTVSGTNGITVADPPPPEPPGNKWVNIRSNTITGTFANGFGGVGTYSFLANLYIPSGTGIVTVKFQPDIFESAGSEFFHIELMPEGDLRAPSMNDILVRFGHFPKDSPFLISAKLVITKFNTDISINLIGKDASGSATFRVKEALIVDAQRFSGVSFGMLLVGPGAFYVDNVIVTRTP